MVEKHSLKIGKEFEFKYYQNRLLGLKMPEKYRE
jgi:hypothetical protein